MFNVLRGLVVLVVSFVAITRSVMAFQDTPSPLFLAGKVAEAHEKAASVVFEFQSVETLIGFPLEVTLAYSGKTVKASPVLMTKSDIGFVAYNGKEQIPSRMFHFSNETASEYFEGSSTVYESPTAHGIQDTKFLVDYDCYLGPCFHSTFGMPGGLEDAELIRYGVRDFEEEQRLLSECKNCYVVKVVTPFGSHKVVDVFHIDPVSFLIVQKTTEQIKPNGTSIKRDRNFTFTHVSEEIPVWFVDQLAEVKSAIDAFTITYIDPDTLDAIKAEVYAQAQREYELEAEKQEQERRAAEQSAKEGEAAQQQPVQQGG